MSPIKCFMAIPTDQVMLSLRRYRSKEDLPCRGPYNFHNAHTYVGARPIRRDSRGYEITYEEYLPDSPLWPTKCEHCDYLFTNADPKQHFTKRLYRREDTGDVSTWDAMPVGACRDCEWLHGTSACGVDGLAIMVKIPEHQDGSGLHEWLIDGRASNCTMPEDSVHKCWCRKGVPPLIHVDKQGFTCAAGAGSVVVPGGFHGFLHNGHIVG